MIGLPDDVIVVVSGLPRSGTSLMMRMLAAGGVPVLVDDERSPDEDNPHGYFEYAPVKRLAADGSWVPRARGHAVKIISRLLLSLPPHGERYRVLFMRRHIDEVLASQSVMLARRGRPSSPGVDFATVFENHLGDVDRWLATQPRFASLDVSYNDLMRESTASVRSVDRFLGGGLDVDAMREVINLELYRQRV